MTADISSLIDSLRQHRLLDGKQLDDLAGQHFSDPQALAAYLVQQGWLTAFQANQLLNGKGHHLVLGQHVILDRIGEGGMGQVFKARHSALGRVAAIKLIHKDRLDNPDAIRRFQREVRAAAQLNHPNVVVAYDADEISGRHLLVMEYVEGASDLSQLVKKHGALPIPQACEYIRQAALGLQHAHEKGLVHRDIKPHNLLLTADGRTVKILDLGLARIQQSTEDKSSTTLTQEGSVMGTPDYISPEQAEDSHTVDIRGDIYSLGCTFYFLLAGRPPFTGAMAEKLLKHVMDDPQPIEELRPDVPPGVAAVVRKMMMKKPEDRFQTPAEVAGVLASWTGQDVSSTQVASRPVASLPAQPVSDTGWSSIVKAAPVVEAPRSAEEPFKTPSLFWPIAVSGVIGVVGLAVIVGLLWNESRKKLPPQRRQESNVTTASTSKDNKEVDLLKLIDPNKHAVNGQWTFEGNTLVSLEGDLARIQLPFIPPDEYEIELVATRMAGNGLFVIGLCAEGNQFVVGLDSVSGRGGGLSLLDGNSSGKNETTYTEKPIFTTGTSSTILSRIGRKGVLVIVDGKPIINWEGNYSRLSLGSDWNVPEQLQLFIGAHQGSFHISKLVLRPLSKDSKERAFSKWLASVQRMPPEKQADAVTKKLQDMNPGFDGKVTHKIENGVVTELRFFTDKVSDISPLRVLKELKKLFCGGSGYGPGKLADLSPLRGLQLTHLTFASSKVSDLSPLKGMPLIYLHCSHTLVVDLSPLRGMPLEALYCGSSQVNDLSPLKGMKIFQLDIEYSPASDLTPLKGLPLTFLNCGQTRITDLSPLQGMQLTALNVSFTQVSNLSVVHNMPLKSLSCIKTSIADLSPLLASPLSELNCDFLPYRDSDVLRSIKTLTKINGTPAAAFWKEVEAKQSLFEAWCKEVAAMTPEKQVDAVASKLKELNPGFDGKVTHKIENKIVTGLQFSLDNITDLSPVRALPTLRELDCQSGGGKYSAFSALSSLKGMSLTKLTIVRSQIADLSPLAGMPLTYLNIDGSLITDLSPLQGMQLTYLACSFSQVADLSPLKHMPLTTLRIDNSKVIDLSPLRGMPLVTLSCNHMVSDLSPLRDVPLQILNGHFNIWRDTEVLRSIKTLTYISGKPAADFWKEMEAKQAAFDAWCKDVATLTAEKQVDAVSARLKELNPGFDGKVTHKEENGVVTELVFFTENVTDVSPVRALTELRRLDCGDWKGGKRGKLADIWPLRGLRLTHLFCGLTQIADLSPLRGMPLLVLWCGGSRVSDLSPLKDMPLEYIDFKLTSVVDISPLKTLPLKGIQIDFRRERDAEILRSIKTLEKINDKPVKEFWEDVDNPKTIDLLALIKPEKHAAQGKWRFEEKMLVCDNSGLAKLHIPYAPGEEYVVKIVAERNQEGGEDFGIGLVVGGRQVLAFFDAEGDVSGLERVDGKAAYGSGTARKGRIFTKSKSCEISCTIRKQHILVKENGRTIIDWKGDFQRLSIHSHWAVPDKRVLFFAIQNSGFHITKIELTPITGEGKKLE